MSYKVVVFQSNTDLKPNTQTVIFHAIPKRFYCQIVIYVSRIHFGIVIVKPFEEIENKT